MEGGIPLRVDQLWISKGGDFGQVIGWEDFDNHSVIHLRMWQPQATTKRSNCAPRNTSVRLVERDLRSLPCSQFIAGTASLASWTRAGNKAKAWNFRPNTPKYPQTALPTLSIPRMDEGVDTVVGTDGSWKATQYGLDLKIVKEGCGICLTDSQGSVKAEFSLNVDGDYKAAYTQELIGMVAGINLGLSSGNPVHLVSDCKSLVDLWDQYKCGKKIGYQPGRHLLSQLFPFCSSISWVPSHQDQKMGPITRDGHINCRVDQVANGSRVVGNGNDYFTEAPNIFASWYRKQGEGPLITSVHLQRSKGELDNYLRDRSRRHDGHWTSSNLTHLKDAVGAVRGSRWTSFLKLFLSRFWHDQLELRSPTGPIPGIETCSCGCPLFSQRSKILKFLYWEVSHR